MDMNLSKLPEMGTDREAWHAAVHGVAKSQIWLSEWTTKKLNNILKSVQFEWTAAYQAPVLPVKSHGWRSLVGCSPWSREELDTTERLHFHFSLSCIGEGNGNPLQCSCLENPRDWGAWWAAIYGVAQSWTWLKRLSSSSSSTVTLLSSPYNITAVKTVMNCPEYKNIYGICI